MIKKFINNEMNDEEIDLMMKDFLEKKQQTEFKNKWGKIIKDYSEPQEKGLVFFFRKHIYITVSAASLIILVGVFSIYYNNDGLIDTPIVYSTSSKGISSEYLELSQLIDKQSFIAKNDYSKKEVYLINLFNKNDYDLILIEFDKISKEDFSDRILFITGISAIKKKDFNNAVSFLKEINIKSEYSADAKRIINLVKNMDSENN